MNSLLETEAVSCTIMDRKTETNPDGGVITTYHPGAPFEAVIGFDQSLQARIADSQGVKNLYTVLTGMDVVFRDGDVFRREEDGKVFRVKSDGNDKKTPKNSHLNMRMVTAEEFKI